MEAYRTKLRKLSGTHWHQVMKKAFGQYKIIKNKSKRRPYIRSAYFGKEKIFLGLFWSHLHEKTNIRDKIRRLKLYPCAMELLQNNKIKPTIKENPNCQNELLYRFVGMTPENELFIVQIKENRKNCQKWLISVFPWDE
jgi:hypothetical protein